ncbi:MAG TPA: hypothetical protein VK998_03225, partial [Schnuerera sp.]
RLTESGDVGAGLNDSAVGRAVLAHQRPRIVGIVPQQRLAGWILVGNDAVADPAIQVGVADLEVVLV